MHKIPRFSFCVVSIKRFNLSGFGYLTGDGGKSMLVSYKSQNIKPMKKLKRNGILLIATLALVGCGSKIKLMPTGGVAEKPQESFKKQVDIPCLETSYDDTHYYRALGSGSATDIRQVRTLAFKDARQRLNMKIANGEETEITFNADVVCEEIMINGMNGLYEGYVVLEIAKDSIRHKQP